MVPSNRSIGHLNNAPLTWFTRGHVGTLEVIHAHRLRYGRRVIILVLPAEHDQPFPLGRLRARPATPPPDIPHRRRGRAARDLEPLDPALQARPHAPAAGPAGRSPNRLTRTSSSSGSAAGFDSPGHH